LADAIYLISAVNNMFPKINLEMDDIESSWAGLRPLIHEEGKSTSELSRKDEIFTSETGLISIAGGKLTGYRKMAERAVDRVAKKMEEDYQIQLSDCTTDTIPLCGNDFKKFKDVKKYIDKVYQRIEPEGLSRHEAWYLVTNYGIQTETILERYVKIEEKDPIVRMAKAELQFGIAYEMIQTPMDFFIRRTGRLYFDIQSVRSLMMPILKEFQFLFKEDDQKIEEWRVTLEAKIDEHSNFSLEKG